MAYFATKNGWTDDTPVPPDVFGRMWTEDLVPEWSKEAFPSA